METLMIIYGVAIIILLIFVAIHTNILFKLYKQVEQQSIDIDKLREQRNDLVKDFIVSNSIISKFVIQFKNLIKFTYKIDDKVKSISKQLKTTNKNIDYIDTNLDSVICFLDKQLKKK